MTEKAKSSKKKPGPPTLGLAVTADFWFWSVLIIFAPSYLDVVSGWKNLFYGVGFLLLIISFAGALMELGNLWKSEGLSYWGVGLVFLIPAIALHIIVYYQLISGTLSTIARIAALILAAVGGPFFFHGIPFFFWKQATGVQEPHTVPAQVQDNQDKKSTQVKTNLEVIANIIIALLVLATAIVTFVEKILP